jgi:hypothetical protein
MAYASSSNRAHYRCLMCTTNPTPWREGGMMAANAHMRVAHGAAYAVLDEDYTMELMPPSFMGQGAK